MCACAATGPSLQTSCAGIAPTATESFHLQERQRSAGTFSSGSSHSFPPQAEMFLNTTSSSSNNITMTIKVMIIMHSWNHTDVFCTHQTQKRHSWKSPHGRNGCVIPVHLYPLYLNIQQVCFCFRTTPSVCSQAARVSLLLSSGSLTHTHTHHVFSTVNHIGCLHLLAHTHCLKFERTQLTDWQCHSGPSSIKRYDPGKSRAQKGVKEIQIQIVTERKKLTN